MAEIDPRIAYLLKHFQVPYATLPCDPELADTLVYCKHYGVPLENSANTILIKAKTGERSFVACVLLASTRLDVNKTARKRLGARRVSFASSDETRALTGMQIGGVTPFALPPTMELWVDARVMEREYIILGGGNRTSKLRVPPSVFEKTENTSIIEGLAKIPAATPAN